MTGRVSYLGHYFGFLRADDRSRVFFHANELLNVNFEDLRHSDRMQFDIGIDRRGRPTAIEISRIAVAAECV